MTENPQDQPSLEKTMSSGEVMTLSSVPSEGWYDVDQWDVDGNNRWNRVYRTYAEAKAEYDRWN